jgi:hypothetical protein
VNVLKCVHEVHVRLIMYCTPGLDSSSSIYVGGKSKPYEVIWLVKLMDPGE